MNRFPETATGHCGFTMIEVIAILVIIGIISAIAVSRMNITEQDIIAQTDIVKAHLRFAQLLALQDDTTSWSIAFTASSYTLYNNGAPATINLPAESSNSHSFPAGVTITNPSTVNFDNWGSPGTTNIPITLSGGGTTATITVTANSGYITP
ncbi:MAG: prepilin-type N-terminal cleavage/methylation domain-containing protein [Syntrophales bacterium LBB04]|nr:prepilin-type N-terminal cleavage/methylation domain-containing protein [Syntrophales bacterium LBB04]